MILAENYWRHLVYLRDQETIALRRIDSGLMMSQGNGLPPPSPTGRPQGQPMAHGSGHHAPVQTQAHTRTTPAKKSYSIDSILGDIVNKQPTANNFVGDNRTNNTTATHTGHNTNGSK